MITTTYSIVVENFGHGFETFAIYATICDPTISYFNRHHVADAATREEADGIIDHLTCDQALERAD
jgi:hypothetical protein